MMIAPWAFACTQTPPTEVLHSMLEPEPSSLPNCGSWKDRITTSEKLWVVGGCDTRHILRFWLILMRMIRERRLDRFDLFCSDHRHIYSAVTTIRTNQTGLFVQPQTKLYFVHSVFYIYETRTCPSVKKLHNTDI